MRYKTYRFCMLVGAVALLAVALYYFINYAVLLNIALGNSGIRAPLQASIRAMWLAFAFQGLLIALLYTLVAFRPRAVSREVIVLLGLLQLLEAVLLFSFAGNQWLALLLACAAVFVLAGALLWPTVWPLPPAQTPSVQSSSAQAPSAQTASAPAASRQNPATPADPAAPTGGV